MIKLLIAALMFIVFVSSVVPFVFIGTAWLAQLAKLAVSVLWNVVAAADESTDCVCENQKLIRNNELK